MVLFFPKKEFPLSVVPATPKLLFSPLSPHTPALPSPLPDPLELYTVPWTPLMAPVADAYPDTPLPKVEPPFTPEMAPTPSTPYDVPDNPKMPLLLFEYPETPMLLFETPSTPYALSEVPTTPSPLLESPQTPIWELFVPMELALVQNP